MSYPQSHNTCITCNTTFTSPKGLKIHMKKTHGNNVNTEREIYQLMLEARKAKLEAVEAKIEAMQILTNQLALINTHESSVVEHNTAHNTQNIYINVPGPLAHDFFHNKNNIILCTSTTDNNTYEVVDKTSFTWLDKRVTDVRFNFEKIICQPPSIIGKWIKECLYDCEWHDHYVTLEDDYKNKVKLSFRNVFTLIKSIMKLLGALTEEQYMFLIVDVILYNFPVKQGEDEEVKKAKGKEDALKFYNWLNEHDQSYDDILQENF